MNYKYDFKEIFKLKDMLEKAGIEHEFIDHSIKDTCGEFTIYQICCPNSSDKYISVIQSFRKLRKRSG